MEAVGPGMLREVGAAGRPDCADVVGRLFAAQRFDDRGVEPALAVPRLSRCYTRAASRTRVLAGPAVGDVAAALAHQADT